MDKLLSLMLEEDSSPHQTRGPRTHHLMEDILIYIIWSVLGLFQKKLGVRQQPSRQFLAEVLGSGRGSDEGQIEKWGVRWRGGRSESRYPEHCIIWCHMFDIVIIILRWQWRFNDVIWWWHHHMMSSSYDDIIVWWHHCTMTSSYDDIIIRWCHHHHHYRIS